MSDDVEHRFENIDWEHVSDSRRVVTTERVVFVCGMALVLALALYDYRSDDLFLVARWRPTFTDWVFLSALVVVMAYAVVPLLRWVRRHGVRRSTLRERPAVLAAGTFLALVGTVGLLGPMVMSTPPLRFEHAFHPPVGFSSSVVPTDCLGRETGEPFERVCHGTWEYPLGTNERGHPMGYLLVEGARVTLYIAVISLAFIIPFAGAVGVVAGYRGGRIDDLLSAYIDVQLSIPAIIVYFVGYMYWGPSILLLLAAFGLLSWGGLARLIRSEVIQRRSDGYVLFARSLGASERYVTAKHVLPNSTNTLVPSLFQLLALFVLLEAAVAFLGFHHLETYSWGATISESVNAAVEGQLHDRADDPAYRIWWVSTLPAVALTATIVSLKILGDGVRDALDPRGERGET